MCFTLPEKGRGWLTAQMLEMFLQRSGYRAQGEAIAIHSRRRFRLLSGNPNMGLPNPDPSLWLIHYSKANPRDQIPAATIPIMPHINNQIQQRRMIQAQGPLARKEFMFQDRANWPIIHPPQSMARPGVPGQIPPGAGHRRGASMGNDATLEEEEDVSRGDILDFMTPRDISRMRYEQHHEWMEEILESPYPTLHIIPSDLGLGRKGPLEELTKDFFDAPTSATDSAGDGPPPRVGKMDPGKAEEFAKRASQKLADMQAELERMKQRHARRMEKLHQTTTLNAAEKKLRLAPNFTERRSMSNGMIEGSSDTKPREVVDEIVAEVESSLGKKVERYTTVTCVAKGGLEDRFSNPSLTNGNAALKSPVKSTAAPPPMENGSVQQAPASTSAVQPQPGGEQPDSTTSARESVRGADTEPPPRVPAEPHEQNEAAANEQRPILAEETPAQGAMDLPQLDDIGVDVNMDGLGDDTNQDGNDWVMIDEPAGPTTEETGHVDVQTPGETPTAHRDVPSQAPESAVAEDSAPKHIPNDDIQAHSADDTGIDAADFDMSGEFDTAGDALASYGQGDDNDDLNLDDIEDTAFGDAFHSEDEHDIS